MRPPIHGCALSSSRRVADGRIAVFPERQRPLRRDLQVSALGTIAFRDFGVRRCCKGYDRQAEEEVWLAIHLAVAPVRHCLHQGEA